MLSENAEVSGEQNCQPTPGPSQEGSRVRKRSQNSSPSWEGPGWVRHITGNNFFATVLNGGRLFAAFGKPLPQEDQIGGILLAMGDDFHAPQQSG
jgi:hypothetical protein